MTQLTTQQMGAIAPQSTAALIARKRALALLAAINEAFSDLRHPGDTITVNLVREYATGLMGADFDAAISALVAAGRIRLGHLVSNSYTRMHDGREYNEITRL